MVLFLYSSRLCALAIDFNGENYRVGERLSSGNLGVATCLLAIVVWRVLLPSCASISHLCVAQSCCKALRFAQRFKVGFVIKSNSPLARLSLLIYRSQDLSQCLAHLSLRSLVHIEFFLIVLAFLDDNLDSFKIINRLDCFVSSVQIDLLVIKVRHGIDWSLTLLEQISLQAGGHWVVQ